MLGKRKSGQNYLEQIPERNPKLTWKEDESGIVILDMVHQGLFDKIAQGLFATPKVSHIRLEAFGRLKRSASARALPLARASLKCLPCLILSLSLIHI